MNADELLKTEQEIWLTTYKAWLSHTVTSKAAADRADEAVATFRERFTKTSAASS